MGTPALPMALITEISTQSAIVPALRVTPPFCMTNKLVTRMNAAQPFILIVQQIGSTKRETSFCAFRLFSAEAMVTGSVAAAYYGVPTDIRQKIMEYMDKFHLSILREFERRYPAATK